MSLLPSAGLSRFACEADMLAPLAESASIFACGARIVFEVPCTAGVPDIVLLQLDEGVIADRLGTQPLLVLPDVRVMLAMSAGRLPLARTWGAEELSLRVNLSATNLRRMVLPRLAASGHLVRDGGGWRLVHRYRSLARRVVTVEAKLRDWRGGVAQASRHTAVADAAWLAVEAGGAATAVNRLAWFTAYGIGLAAVSYGGLVTRIADPGPSRARRPERELLVERAAAIHLEGRASGPLPKVFGRTLVASTGADPRFSGVVVR